MEEFESVNKTNLKVNREMSKVIRISKMLDKERLDIRLKKGRRGEMSLFRCLGVNVSADDSMKELNHRLGEEKEAGVLRSL